jgi:hypothetical protein
MTKLKLVVSRPSSPVSLLLNLKEKAIRVGNRDLTQKLAIHLSGNIAASSSVDIILDIVY